MLNKCPIVKSWLIGSTAVVVVTASLAFTAPAMAQRAASTRRAAFSQDDFEAVQRLRRAEELLELQEADRAIKLLQSILDDFPGSDVRYHAALALGKRFLEDRNQPQAIRYLATLRQLDDGMRELTPELKEVFLEGLFLLGVANFDLRNYASVFPSLRRITSDYPNSQWANEAYYYIGLAHFAQGNWTSAIEALSKVGSFIDPNSTGVQYVEAGRRFYIRLEDVDLPVQYRLGRKINVTITTQGGDEEVVTCVPLSAREPVFIGSIPTEMTKVEKGDGKVQVVAGEKITTSYTDANTVEGKADVQRTTDVQVVSSAGLNFTLGDFVTRADSAYLSQTVFVALEDADLDVSTNADAARIRLMSRYRANELGADGGDLIAAAAAEIENGQAEFLVRDEVELELVEHAGAAEGPVRTGRFVGRLKLTPAVAGQPIDRGDSELSADIGDELVATYVDERHIEGNSPRQITAATPIVRPIDDRPRAVQYIVPDAVIRAKKQLVEAQAFLELAKIFNSMGLRDGAGDKADEGLERVDAIVRERQPLDSEILQEAFRTKWELHLAEGDLNRAIAACRMFNQMFPQSPMADEALMQIGQIHIEQEQYEEAIRVFTQILTLPNSAVKAQAQFLIAQTHERTVLKNPRQMQAAINAYKQCAERFPDSPYAGESLGKLVDYHINTRDFSQADDLLERIVEDYPDAAFLDSMLIKWVMVAYYMRDYQKAYEKCSQLILEYPSSRFADKAREILPNIERRLPARTDG